MSRGLWFVTGAGAGIFAMVKARRAAETFTPDGLRDRVAGLNAGAHLFAEEVRAGMTEKETELRGRLGLAADGPRELATGGPGEAVDPGLETLAEARSSTNGARTSTTGEIGARSSTTESLSTAHDTTPQENS